MYTEQVYIFVFTGGVENIRVPTNSCKLFSSVVRVCEGMPPPRLGRNMRQSMCVFSLNICGPQDVLLGCGGRRLRVLSLVHLVTEPKFCGCCQWS